MKIIINNEEMLERLDCILVKTAILKGLPCNIKSKFNTSLKNRPNVLDVIRNK
jgi:hypothetical protein